MDTPDGNHGAQGSPLDDRPVLILSPHLDDAILSTFSVVSSLACEVWTVFAGTPSPARATDWDARCGFTDSDETMSARTVEDEAAFADLPASTRRLDAIEGAYVDSPERRRSDLASLTADLVAWLDTHPGAHLMLPAGAGIVVPPPPWARVQTWLCRLIRAETSSERAGTRVPPRTTGSVVDRVAGSHQRADASTAAWAGSSDPAARLRSTAGTLGSLLATLARRAKHVEHVRRRARAMKGGGLAQNPDHIELRDHVLGLALARPDVQVSLYEELPYLWHRGADDAVAALGTRWGVSAEMFTRPVDVERKAHHLASYASQMPVMDPAGRLMRAVDLPRLERYWALAVDPRPTPS